MRRILHIDADAFFASIEQRDNPALRGKPVAVGSDSPRGVVAAASYEARRFGVGSAMPSRMARERCPDLIFVRPRISLYSQIGGQLREIYRRYTELVEPVSIDEAYLDVTDPLTGPPSGTIIARLIRRDVRRETGLTVTAGVSYNKFLAKTASGMNKPDGLTVILAEDAPELLARLPVSRFHGIGPRTTERLNAMGIRTGKDIADSTREEMVRQFGKAGGHYWLLAHGVDERPVEPHSERKSASIEETFDRDLESVQELSLELPALAEGLARRLERSGTMGQGVTVKLKYSDHTIVSRQQGLPLPVRTAPQILTVARQVLHTRFELEQPVRLLGVGVYDMVEGGMRQPPLFPDWDPRPALMIR